MKKCAIFMMLGIFALLQASAYQYEAWVEGTKWYYNIKDGEAEITYGGDEYGGWSYDADIYSGDLVIPEYINGYSVTSIGEYAFCGCDSLTSIDIPGSIKTVGWGAFQECSSLQYVGTDSLADWCKISFADESANPLYYADEMYIGGTPLGGQLNLNTDIKSIGPYAFAGCSWMTKVVMWDIRSIGDGAFYECDGLREISGGWDVTEIGFKAFWGCNKLTREGIMGLSNSQLSVGRSAFYGCDTLADADGFVVVHNTLYGYCGSAKTLALPEGIKEISDAAFYYNQTVETLTMPTSLVSYGSAAFFMSKVKNFNIKDLSKWCEVSCENPQWVRLYHGQDNHVFVDGVEIVDLVVPDGVTSIGKASFYGCPNLHSVSLPNSVTSLGEMAFDSCLALRRLTTPGNLVLAGSALEVAEIVIADGSTSIVDGAFAECKTVTSVTIPASVMSLGENVFRGCDNLTDIYFQGDAPTGIENLRRLYSSYGMVTLHVRKGTRGWHACFTDDPNSAQYHIIIEDTEVPVDVEMGGDSAWTQDGGRGYCSGAIDDYQSSKMSVVVDGPTTLAFDWKVSSEEHYDFVSVFLDGELMDRISGSCTDWATVSLSVPKGNGHIVEWSYDKDCETSYGEDKAWVRGIRIGSAVTPFMWVEDSYEGTHCKNAPIGDGESCESSFLATGFGSVYFDLDVSTEKDHDFFQIYIDGVLSESYSGQVSKRSCSVWCDGEKTHRVTFKYVKDASGSDGQDMVRISNFQPYNVKLAWLENGDPMPVENATWVCNDYSSGITRTLAGSGDSVLPMTVSGAGNLTFCWRKLKNSDRLSLYVDGEEAAVCSGSAESQDYGMGYTDGWSYFTYKIMTGGTHQIEWKWKAFGYSEGNAAEIKDVVWGGARQSPWLDNGEEAGKELFGNAKWSRVGEEVFKSGEIGPNQESDLPIYFYSDFYGPAPSLQFEWKVSCGEGDRLVCEVDGSETDYRSKSISGQTDWQSVSVELNSDTGLHSIRWKFKRGNGAPAGENCAWVRNVAFDMAYDDHFKIQWPRMELVGQEEDPGEDPQTYKWSTQVYSDGLVTLTGVSPQPQGVVTLPTEVDGVKVQSISDDVFYWNDKSKIVGVVVPEGYEKIGDFAFSGISNLKAVSLPSTLVELGEAAFSECRSLSYVRLPPALEIIGEWAFEGCAMTHVKVPEGVLEIGSEAFCCMTPRLQEVLLPSTVDSIGFDYDQGETVNPFAACAEGCIIAFPHGNASYEVVNGNLIQSSSRLLLSGVVKGGSVIPADVRSIAALAYYRQPTLTEISIPASVKRVGLNAFQESGLERVEMKDGGVEFIDCGAFSMNYSLREIKLPQGLQSIRGEFAYGSLVERLEIPDTVTYLGGPNLVGTFYEMTNLAEVVFNGDAPTQIHVPEQMFGLTPESLTVKVRRGSKGWDGDPRSCELPSTGVWPDTYASRGRKIEWYGEDPASWSINWWEDLGASATDPTWKFSRGVMSTDAYESPSLSTGSLTNFVEFTFDGEGVFSCEARLNDGGRTSNKYIRLYVDGELLMNVSAQYNQKWQSLDCLVRGDGRHNVRIGFLIPNTKYNGGPTVCSLQNVKWEPRSQGEVAVYDWQIADNGDGTVTLTGVTPEPRYELVIPSDVGGKTVTALGDSLLKDCRFVSVVTVPETVKIIKPYVFYGCKGLRTVNLPNGLLEIGTYAFFGCSSLAFIELPQSLKTIGAYAFMSSGLESVTLPGGLTSVGEEAFYCSKLASIMIPAGVQNIGYRMLNEDGAIAVVYVEDGDANRVCKMLKSSSIIVSKLTFRTQGVPCSDCYPLSYELNGGVNAISNPDVYDVRDLPLALADPTRKGYDFAGWTLDGQPITSLPADSTGAKTVKATWVVHQVRLDEALNCEGVTITTSGNASWFGQSSVTHDGVCAARSGAISGNQSSSMEVSVVGPATVSFWWKVSSESVSYDYLEFKVDGTQRNKIGGTSGSWAFVSVSLGTGTHKLVWKYQKDGSVDAGSDCGWVDELVIMNLPTALNLSGMSVTTDNSSGWTAQKDVTHDGSMAARSGAIGSGQTSSMSIPVTGPAKVSFWWKVSSESSYDCLSVSLDSSSKGSISGLQEWSQVTIDVPSGSHTITWRYTKDGSVDSGDDCGWVDQVVVSRINVVSFDANGGNPSVADRTYEGEQVYGTLPVVSRRGCRFLGWYTSTTGGTKIVPTMTVTTSLTLYAQWEFEKVDLGIALGVEENSVSTSGCAEWFGQITESHDGSHAARSGKISGGQTSSMDVVVEGPADISFWWKVSSESDIYDYLQFFIDGTAQDKIGGTGGDWAQKSFSIGGGDHILTWSYVKDGSVDKGEDCGWVDDIVITPKTYSITYENVRGGANDNPVSYTAGDSIVFAPLADTTDARFVAWNPERIEKGTTGDKIVTAIWETKVLADLVRGASAVSTDGAQPWCVLWDGSDWLLRSGHIGNDQTSDLSATVRGKGKLLFSWKVNSETHVDRGVTLPYDEATFTVGDVKKELYGDQAWTPVQVDLGEGEHQLTWRFIKDVMDENWVGEDCVWLKDVQWIPDSIIPDLSTLRMLFGDDSDMAAKITTNEALLEFNVFLANCGVTRSDELNDTQKTWAYQSFKLAEITTAPRLFEEEPVLKIDDIELTGGNLSLTISLTAGAEAIQLAKDKLAEKIRVGSTLGDITGKPTIVASPAADGTSLTFTITPPVGNQGFVRVLID